MRHTAAIAITAAIGLGAIAAGPANATGRAGPPNVVNLKFCVENETQAQGRYTMNIRDDRGPGVDTGSQPVLFSGSHCVTIGRSMGARMTIELQNFGTWTKVCDFSGTSTSANLSIVARGSAPNFQCEIRRWGP